MSIAISEFVRRQTPESRFSHYEGLSDSEFLSMVKSNFDKGRQGYKEGVLLVQIDPEGFFSGIVKLQAGDKLAGVYEPRKDNEDPRKATWAVGGQKIPAKRVDIILYSHDVLAENNEHSCDADWEIISINASPINEEIPIPVGALIANHFEMSGGTSTGMTSQEFVDQLKTSVLWWADKSMAG